MKSQTTKEQVMKEFEKILSAYNAEILNKYQDEYLMEKGPGCEQVLFPVLEKAKKDFLEVPNDGYIKHPGDVLKDFSSTYDTAYEIGYEEGQHSRMIDLIIAMEEGEEKEWAKNIYNAGIKDAMELNIDYIWKHRTADNGDIVYSKFSKEDLRLALSELLKK